MDWILALFILDGLPQLKDYKRLEKFGKTTIRAGLTGIHQIHKGSSRSHF